jgi:Ca2+:H+ antiporter
LRESRTDRDSTIDAIRKAARRQAWYDDGKSAKTYNPFSRPGPRPGFRADDEERQLQHANTDNDTVSPLEARRHDFSEAETRDFRPAKGKTWPAPADGENRAAVDESPAASSKSEDDVKSLDHTRSADNTPTDQQHVPAGEIDTSAGPTDADGKPRKRRGRKFFAKLGLKKSDEKESKRDDKDNSKSKHKKNPNITIKSQLRAVFFSWINILLVAVPAGIALSHTGVNAIVVFCVNFIAIIPLAALLSYATEELALYVGEVLGGLLNASFGNAVELIVSIIALTQGKVVIVQTSLVGSMLSNLLLVLGMCFFFGGINRVEQSFNIVVSGTAASLLSLAIGVFIIPAAFAQFTPGDGDDGVTPLSRGVAVLLLLVYAAYLIFQLKTHTDVYNEKSEKALTHKEKARAEAQQNGRVGSVSQGVAAIGAGTAAASGGFINEKNLVSDKKNDPSSTDEEDEDEEVPQLTRLGALITLAGSTVLIALCSESMVSAIDVLKQDISEEFIGLILLPIVGNAAEHATAVTVAIKDKMDLAIGVAVGSSLQIALLIFPFMVLINWFGVGSPADLNLNMDGFQVAVLFISIILVNYVIQDGKSHWLEGVMLMTLYISIAVASFVYRSAGDVA